MPKIPTDIPDHEPGVYLAEIRSCRESTSKSSGNPMFTVTWVAVDWNMSELCTDYLVFSKKTAGMVRAKFDALGFEGVDDVEAGQLKGVRCYLKIVHEEFKGRVSCKVEIDFDDGCRAGYWRDDELPENVEAWVMRPDPEQKAALDDDMPF